MSLLDDLNSGQRAAATTTEPVVVVAGAGTGKTRVITYRVAWLISEGVSPDAILAVTFTNKAAREMRERVGKLLAGRNAKGMTISTFHSLGMQILREEAPLLGYKQQFSILDSADTAKIISELLGSPDKGDIRDAQTAISNWKAAFLSPQQAAEQIEHKEQQHLALLYGRYQETLRAYQAVDFDDLMCGHDWLKQRGRRHEWGVGRHLLGSQIFDYWRDPWGHTLEHWTDGDLLDAAWGSRVSSIQEVTATQWGPLPPKTMGS